LICDTVSNTKQQFKTMNKEDLSSRTFIRFKDLKAIYGLDRTTAYRWVKAGKLPEPKKLSPRMVGWNREVLDAIFLTEF
jgi:predicted DNA-binding transcriptional regulator AlpA